MAEWVSRTVDHVGHTQQYTTGPFECVRGSVGRAPLGDDVVMCHIGASESRRYEMQRSVGHRALDVRGVKQTVRRELRVEGESGEAAGERGVRAIRVDGRNV